MTQKQILPAKRTDQCTIETRYFLYKIKKHPKITLLTINNKNKVNYSIANPKCNRHGNQCKQLGKCTMILVMFVRNWVLKRHILVAG